MPKKKSENDIEQDEQQVETKKSHRNCLIVHSGNETMLRAREKRPPIELYPHLIFEGECSCLFSDTNVGKSIFAVQLGVDIARFHGRTVLYFDFELSDRQFYSRYSDGEVDYQFPDTFHRAEIRPYSTTEYILDDIEATAEKCKASVLIIDNLTWLCADAEDGAAAADFMKRISEVKRRHRWTIIVIAHTPKIADGTPISVNNLAGSKQLSNFFDAIFAIGRSGSVMNERYLKQVKVRAEKMTYDADNVAVFNIQKVDAMLQFVPAESRREAVLLMDGVQREIVDRMEQGETDEDIAKEMSETVTNIRKLRKYARKELVTMSGIEADAAVVAEGKTELTIVGDEDEDKVEELSKPIIKIDLSDMSVVSSEVEAITTDEDGNIKYKRRK